MESIATLKQQFDYDLWANRRVVETLSKPINMSPTALRTLAHILFAEKTWLERMLENLDTTDFDFWPDLSVSECRDLLSEVEAAYSKVFEELTEEKLERIASYRNSQGIEYETSWRDILMHVFEHSAYHRGQVAAAIRRAGGEPPYTDYIAFVREGASGE